jgi:hypothetical protein
VQNEKGIITFNKKYAEEKKGTFLKKMKNGNSFVFECNMKHRFVLSNKQVINGKWCNTCTKTIEKLRRKISKESLTVLSFNGSEKNLREIKSLLAGDIKKCESAIEDMMIQEKVQAEVQERKNLESGFKRWRRRAEQTQAARSKLFFSYSVYMSIKTDIMLYQGKRR